MGLEVLEGRIAITQIPSSGADGMVQQGKNAIGLISASLAGSC